MRLSLGRGVEGVDEAGLIEDGLSVRRIRRGVDGLRRHLPEIKEGFAPDRPMGVGLRLAALNRNVAPFASAARCTLCTDNCGSLT